MKEKNHAPCKPMRNVTQSQANQPSSSPNPIPNHKKNFPKETQIKAHTTKAKKWDPIVATLVSFPIGSSKFQLCTVTFTKPT